MEEASYSRSNFIYGVNSNEEIVQTITGFIEEIISYGVSRENVHLIASSSVVNGENLDDLNALLGQKTQLNIVGISAENEAKYALAATVPQEFLEESFVVDIGSGNSKLSWVSNQDTLSIEIHGSKYFLSDIQDTTVFREVRDAVLQIPEENRNLCFMLGGMIYEFAKDKMLGSEARYVVLDAPNSYPVDNEKLKAANVIYNALYLEPTYSYIFDRDSNFSIGYLIVQNQSN